MRIDPDGTIAGHPAMLVRKLLRRGASHDWNVLLVEDVLNCSADDAASVMRELAGLGFIEPAQHMPVNESWWRNTMRGNALANASAAKPIRRATAEAAVSDLLRRVAEVNADSYYLYSVRFVVVFGSFLSDTPTVNDVDVALELTPRNADREVQAAAESHRIEEAMRSGRRFSNIVQVIGWPQDEVWLKLKSRSRTLSLHDLRSEAELIKHVTNAVLYSADPDHPTPPALLQC